MTWFALDSLHKNRPRFHKKEEGIVLFETEIRCLPPQEITVQLISYFCLVILFNLFLLLLCGDASVHK